MPQAISLSGISNIEVKIILFLPVNKQQDGPTLRLVWPNERMSPQPVVMTKEQDI